MKWSLKLSNLHENENKSTIFLSNSLVPNLNEIGLRFLKRLFNAYGKTDERSEFSRHATGLGTRHNGQLTLSIVFIIYNLIAPPIVRNTAV